jgi:flagellar biosynthesis/type III secretory pathway protein FliH
MPSTFVVNLSKPIKSVRISDCSGDVESSSCGGISAASNTESTEDLQTQKRLYHEVCQTLQNIVAKLAQFYDAIFTEQKDQIAKLSVEIARKILMGKVEDGDYEIESIVKETLKSAPTHQDLVVHLNPQDLADCQKACKDDGGEALADIKLVADHNIGRAECVLESSKGIIESLIDKHLEQIGKALKKAG